MNRDGDNGDRDRMSPRQLEAGQGRPWWQTCRLDDLRAICERKTIEELQSLSSDMRGLLALLQGQIEAPGPDADQAWRTRRAHAFLCEKSRMVRGLLAGRLTREQAGRMTRKRAPAARAREAFERGDLQQAVAILIEIATPEEHTP